MVLIKILKRRDASSVIVAILLALIITQPLNVMTMRLSAVISHSDGFGGYPGGWKNAYLYPLVSALVQIIVLEILAWIIVLANRPVKRKR